MRSAVERFLPELATGSGEKVTFITRSVTSGVAETPTTVEALMSGARNRALALITLQAEEGFSADYFVGLEGGFYRVTCDGETHTFLQSWAYISDGRIGHFGSSGSIEVPDELAWMIYEEGASLGEAIDGFTGGSNVRDHEGASGVLTRSQITRQGSFELAITAAFAPFYNRGVYGD